MHRARFVMMSVCYALWVSPGLAGSACVALVEAVIDGHAHEGHTHAGHGTEGQGESAHPHGDDDGSATANRENGDSPDDCCVDLYTGGAAAFTSPTKIAAVPSFQSCARDLAHTPVEALQQAQARLRAGRPPPAPGSGRPLCRPPPLYLLHSSFLI